MSSPYVEKIILSAPEYVRALKAARRAIDDKYAQVGGFLGQPVKDVEFGGKDYDVPYRKYEGGAIYVTRTGTRVV